MQYILYLFFTALIVVGLGFYIRKGETQKLLNFGIFLLMISIALFSAFTEPTFLAYIEEQK